MGFQHYQNTNIHSFDLGLVLKLHQDGKVPRTVVFVYSEGMGLIEPRHFRTQIALLACSIRDFKRSTIDILANVEIHYTMELCRCNGHVNPIS